ncbi:hypothetical protein ACFL6I_00770 [candidate division KSB1 bacterium]
MNFKKFYRIVTGPCLFIAVLICMLNACSSMAGAQEYRDILLKKVGNLYILNVGGNDNLQSHRIYNLFFEEAKRIPLLGFTIKTNRQFFGAVQVTQLFPGYCVVRIVARYMEEEPAGNRVVLVKRELSEEVLQRAYEASGLALPKEVREEIEAAREGETIAKTVIPLRDESYRPFSLGINYFHDLDQIAEPIANNLSSSLDRDIYRDFGVFGSDYSSSGGISLFAEKMITHRFMVRGGLSYIVQNAGLNTNIDPDAPRDPGLVSVKNWNFNIKSKILDWSLALQYSNFRNALSYFTGEERGRAIQPRLGVGVNHATVDVEMDEAIVISKYTGDDEQSHVEKFSMGGYWGVHGIAGIDYYTRIGKVYWELNYQHWFSDKFRSNMPFRFGAVIYF